MKKLKLFLAVILLINIFIVIFTLSACKPKDDGDDNKITPPPIDGIVEPYKFVGRDYYTQNNNPHITDYFDDETKLDIEAKITSFEELKNFCNEKKLQIFNENYNPEINDSLTRNLRKYDDNFFEKRSLLIILRFKETYDNYSFDSLNIQNDTISIKLVSANGNSLYKISTNSYLFEISKTVSEKTNKITVIESKGELDQKVTTKIHEFNNLNIKKDAIDNYIISSKEFLNTFCNEETSPFFEKNNLSIKDVYPDVSDELLNDEEFIKMFNEMYNERNKQIIQLLDKYDSEFFQQKSLIFIMRNRGDNRFYKLDKFDIEGNAINVTLATPDLGNNLPISAVVNCLYLFEIDKNQITDTSQININEIVL